MSTAPRERARQRVSSSPKAVMRIIGIRHSTARSCSRISRPEQTGIRTSEIKRSIGVGALGPDELARQRHQEPASVGHLRHVVAVLLERLDDESAHGFVVLRDQDPRPTVSGGRPDA